MLLLITLLWKTLTRFRGYEPQAVDPLAVSRWLLQYPASKRRDLCLLLDKVVFLSRGWIKASLVALNDDLTARLGADGIGPERTIYVSIDSAGSSSHVMLNLLRDSANLERKGATLIDSKNNLALARSTGRIKQGAIVYVDDFCGTGRQFRKNRDWSVRFIEGTFSEFFLAPVICEEAMERFKEARVEPLSSMVHLKLARPLHPESSLMDPKAKARVTQMCLDMNQEYGLGFYSLATCVVLYRNAPNTTPLVLRGNLRQDPLRGIFPRADDLRY